MVTETYLDLLSSIGKTERLREPEVPLQEPDEAEDDTEDHALAGTAHPGEAISPVPSMVRVGFLAAVRFAAIWTVSLLILGISGTFAWSFAEPQLTKPYVYDEAAFAFAGHAVASTGLPWSNLGHLQTLVPGDFSERFNWALWHPPLYVFALGEAYKRLGETETSARLLGIACNATAAGLVFVTSIAVIWPVSRAAPIYAAIASSLYMTNPFVLQSALLLDIDGTVLVATISLAMLAYTLVLGNPRPLRHPLSVALLLFAMVTVAFSLWAKMTSILALIGVATAYRIVGRPWRPWRLLIELPVIAGGGLSLFLGTWWLVASRMGMPFEFPFEILLLELDEAAGSTGSWLDNPAQIMELVSHVALWTSPYLMGLFIWAGAVRVTDIVGTPLRWVRTKWRPDPSVKFAWGLEPIDFVVITGAGIGLVYLIKLAASFPKYHITMMPFLAVGVAYLIARCIPSFSWWEPVAYATVLAGMTGYFSLVIGDRLVLFRDYGFVLPLLGWPGLMGFGFMILGAVLGKVQLPRQFAILGVLLTCAWSWGVNTTQADAGYSTAYNYGITGQRETAMFLDTILKPGERFVASREVAYYTHETGFIDQDVWWADIEARSARGEAAFDGTVIDKEVNVLALFLWDPVLGKIAHGYLANQYEAAFQSGVFVVFVRTD
ncbi:MAG: hypothetical protein NTX54_04265 [Chloroflexi bacterium]|nr:hypothetical protein [Chloroflexota bacterium]